MLSMRHPFPEMHDICNSRFKDMQVPTFPETDDVTCGSLKHSFDAAYSAGWLHHMATASSPPIGDSTPAIGQADQLNANHAWQQPSQQRGTPVNLFDVLPDPPVQAEQRPQQAELQKATLLRISDYMPEGAQQESQVNMPNSGTIIPPCATMTEPNVLAGDEFSGQHALGQQCQSHPFHPQMTQSQPALHMQQMNEPQIMPRPTIDMPAHMQQLATHMEYTQQPIHTGPDPSQLQNMQYMPPFGQMPQAPQFQQFQHAFEQLQLPMLPQQMQHMHAVQPLHSELSWQPLMSPPKHSAQ